MLNRNQILDETTGEIVKSTVFTFPAAFDEEKGYLFWTRKAFAKSFLDIPFPDSMSKMDIANMTLLSKHIWSNTNMLGYRGHGGVQPFNLADIAKAIKVKPRQARNFILKMIKLGMIAKVDVVSKDNKDTHYYVNPIYYFSNNRLSLNLYLIFRQQLDEVLPSWAKNKYAAANINKK